ncbi:MAG TPA: carboxypeptidase-like regulatory domain-containing protein [Terriglobales bacterium]|nr:carboxypeptidase-like regulatory domain-containing protein [Terriglobales bacterium]
MSRERLGWSGCKRAIVALVCWTAITQVSATGQEPRIPGKSPTASAKPAALLGTVKDENGRPVNGVTVSARSRATNKTYTAVSNSEGIFRLRDLPPGSYDITASGAGYGPRAPATLSLTAGQALEISIKLESVAGAAPAGPAAPPTEVPTRNLPGKPGGEQKEQNPSGAYPGVRSAQPQQPPVETKPEEAKPEEAKAEAEPASSVAYVAQPYRWTVEMPSWQRYEKPGEFPYVKSHWYDPFNRNKLKGDYPIFGQRWFFDFTGTSESIVDVRRLPVPSGITAEQPNENNFFGKGEQGFGSETFFLSADLSRGDTSFRPADFRIRFTPAFNLNFLQTRERGLVDINPAAGINRFDSHIGLQEGFVEAKLHDLSPNFDFISLRVGIQQFNSDFRGFLFSDEQPGARLFGNLRSNRISYNLAYFYLLEKNTNSELNTFQPRHQQVAVGNVYIQDFLAKGYTTEFSFHYNRDDPTVHFDDNGFLVRPAPIGAVVTDRILTHGIRAYYIGWTSNGHIGPINVSHAFYQALGHDDFNPIAARRVNINAQLGALELSVDKNWIRFRGSFLFQSGDGNNRTGTSRRDDTARGFDTIVDDTNFAGGAFSFWDSEGIRLTGTGVGLTTPGSLLVNLRSNKFEGQANFVNPGLFLYNAGIDFNVTPKLRAFVNGSYLRFDRTEPLELVLFQSPITHNIGTDVGLGFEYRPPLSENIVITAGTSGLIPAQGFEQVFNPKSLISGFAKIKFQF